MKKKMLMPLFLFLLVVLLSNSSVAAQNGREFVKDELLVKFNSNVHEGEMMSAITKVRGKILERFRIVGNLVHIQLPTELAVPEAIALLRKNPLVEYVDPNYIRYATITPNDSYFSYLWGLHNTGQTGGTVDADIDAPEAWDITTGDANNVIAVIDTGVDMSHEDLSANIWTNPDEIPGNGIDDDLNGYIDDVNGWDFYANDNDPSDTTACKHGTHVSGTIGAVGNNGKGVAGVSWNVKIMPLRFLGGTLCSGSDANALKAVQYAAEKGVRISNNSWGGGGYNRALEDAIRNSNMIFVAAAGNGGWDGIGDNNDTTPEYPANYSLDNIISVAAVDHNDIRASFSNYGQATVDLAAPGVNVWSTVPGNQYAYMSGTSMATPHVAGTVGLILAQNPALENWQVVWKLLQGVDKKGLQVLSGGRLNAYNSLLQYDPLKSRFEESSLISGGIWNSSTNPGFSGGIVKYSNRKNAAIGTSFSGSGVMWIATKAAMLGKADVYIDGTYKTTVDLYNPTVLHQQIAYSNLALSNSSHTIKIVVRGDKNPSATNTFIDVDAVDVVN